MPKKISVSIIIFFFVGFKFSLKIVLFCLTFKNSSYSCNFLMDLELVLLDTYVPKSLNDFADSDDENSNGVPQKCMSNEAMMKLYEMRVANVLCDAELRLEDGEIFSVHRLILCTCSTYFR